MAECCLDCFNKYDMKEDNKLTKRDVFLYPDFCEGCGKIKPCVISIKRKGWNKIYNKSKK